ncbi:DUF4080 domain-containing protein [bacterium]|nr:DUF4080 domain-containing protein [bacterium]
MSKKIILTTLNARYHHTSLGLRYLKANLKEFKDICNIIEFTISESPIDIAEKIIIENPTIVGFGIYIWNYIETTEVIKIIKSIYPQIVIVIGGPEVSYDYENLDVYNFSDYHISGEGEERFYYLCKNLLSEEKIFKTETELNIDLDNYKNLPKSIKLEFNTDLNYNKELEIESPYSLYSDSDIQNRYIYVESSRGCPFGCHFCLSALDKKVRYFSIDKFLLDMDMLWKKGAREFKFIDRTFNLNDNRVLPILEFFKNKNEPFFLHFEVVPDRLSEKLKEIVKDFPLGSLQFEVGIQTRTDSVSKRVGRFQNYQKIEENIRFLNSCKSVHLHTDLIIGLPGESLEEIEAGFNWLLSLDVEEIQVGILKKLRGAIISIHDKNFNMIYETKPPYRVLQNSTISFLKMRELTRFAKYWDLCFNSGNFPETMKILLEKDETPFKSFLNFSNYLYKKVDATHSISLDKLAENLSIYLDEKESIKNDYLRVSGRKLPNFLKDEQSTKKTKDTTYEKSIHHNKRQIKKIEQ